MSKLARPITRDEIAAYRVTGVVLLRGVLDLATVNSVRRCIDEAARNHPAPAAIEDVSLLKQPSADGDGTPANERAREFRRFTQRGPGPEIAASLLGGEQICFYGERIDMKEPGDRKPMTFHQDAADFDIAGEQCCVLWIPVDPVTVESGAMQYWRGSHKDGKIYRPHGPDPQTPPAGAEPLPDLDGHPGKYDIVHFDVEPGDVIVHHYRIVHGAGGNMSRYQVRRAASLRYCGDDIRYCARPWVARQVQQPIKLNNGDPLSGTDFPVVWRRRHDQQAA